MPEKIEKGDFACAYARKHKVNISIGGVRILQHHSNSLLHEEDFIPFETKMKINTNLISMTKPEYEAEQEISYATLKDLGFMITSEPVKKGQSRMFKGQKVVFKLVNTDTPMHETNEIPKGHRLTYHPTKKEIWLRGRGYADGVTYKTAPPKPTIDITHTSATEFAGLILKSMSAKEQVQEIRIDEVPVMITFDGRLLCTIHKGNTPYSYGAFGSRGGGKTLLLHSIADSLFWKYNDTMLCYLNDQLNQFWKWTYMQDNRHFNEINSIINHQKRAQPVVYLYPSFVSEEEMSKTNPRVSHKISIPEEDVLKNWDSFFQGLPNMQLAKSSKWYEKIVDEIINVPWDKKDELISSLFLSPDKSNKVPDPTHAKIKQLLAWIHKQKILDTSSGVTAEWEINGEKLDPLSACMKAGLIPCLENQEIAQNLGRKEYYPNYMSYWIEKIWDNCNNRRLGNKRCYMLLDEIGDFYKTGGKKNKLYESLIKLFTKGRKPNIAPMYSIQAKGKVDEEILLNTNYSFFFSTPERGIFPGLKKEVENEVQRLRPLECIAIARNTHFVAYEPNGDRTEIDPGKAIKGISLIYPTSAHAVSGE